MRTTRSLLLFLPTVTVSPHMLELKLSSAWNRDAEVQFRTKVRTELLRTGLKVRFKVRIFAEPDFKSSSRFSRSRKVRTKFKPITSAMDFLGILDSFRMNLAPKRSFGGLCAGGKTNKSLIELT